MECEFLNEGLYDLDDLGLASPLSLLNDPKVMKKGRRREENTLSDNEGTEGRDDRNADTSGDDWKDMEPREELVTHHQPR